MKKILLIIGLLVLMASTSFITTLINDTETIDPETLQEIVDKAIPIILGVVTGLVSSLLKSRSLETIFQNMAEEGKDMFALAATNVNTVTKESTETRKLVRDTNDEIRSIKKELVEVKKVKDTVGEIKEILLLMALNDENLVKNGIAKRISKVGEKDET